MKGSGLTIRNTEWGESIYLLIIRIDVYNIVFCKSVLLFPMYIRIKILQVCEW